MNTLALFSLLLLFQEGITSTEDGVPYTPNEGPNWLLILAAVATVAIVAIVVTKVFKGIARSRNQERIAEDSNSAKSKNSVNSGN
uniref:Uncharacterized protein n=1 Tax=Roseihalotalea indica TaxID=2867963 RepID=A0AA49GMZ4_9BACT|nr:hypothetical protein K4G66_28950 [Tunicatimonas sp. TK19036]